MQYYLFAKKNKITAWIFKFLYFIGIVSTFLTEFDIYRILESCAHRVLDCQKQLFSKQINLKSTVVRSGLDFLVVSM